MAALPHIVLSKIFSYLGPWERLQIEYVCQRWREFGLANMQNIGILNVDRFMERRNRGRDVLSLVKYITGVRKKSISGVDIVVGHYVPMERFTEALVFVVSAQRKPICRLQFIRIFCWRFGRNLMLGQQVNRMSELLDVVVQISSLTELHLNGIGSDARIPHELLIDLSRLPVLSILDTTTWFGKDLNPAAPLQELRYRGDVFACIETHHFESVISRCRLQLVKLELEQITVLESACNPVSYTITLEFPSLKSLKLLRRVQIPFLAIDLMASSHLNELVVSGGPDAMNMLLNLSSVAARIAVLDVPNM